MNEPDIKIVEVKAKDIYEFACNAASQLKKDDILPISRQRALAWSKNPYADANDTVLYVAYHNGRCVGYRGEVPGLIYDAGKLYKVIYPSTGYVIPEYRRFQVAIDITEAALSKGNDFVVTGLSSQAEKFYRLMGWHALTPVEIHVINISASRIVNAPLRLIRHYLNKASPTMRIAKRIESFAGNVIYYLNRIAKSSKYQLLKWYTRRFVADISWHQTSNYTDNSALSTKFHKTDTCFYRGPEIVDWMLQYPWIVERGARPDDSKAYFFSNIREIFRYIPLIIIDNSDKQPLGFVVLQLSKHMTERTLKVLDYGPSDPKIQILVAGIAIQYAASCSADVINMPSSVGTLLKRSFPFRYIMKTRNLVSYFHSSDQRSPLKRVAQRLVPTSCDCDLAFT